MEATLDLSTSGINNTDRSGRTALSWAAERGDKEAVSKLLHFGADPDIADILGLSPLHYAYMYTRITALMVWVSDPHSRDDEIRTQLRIATREPDYDIIRLLLSHMRTDYKAGTELGGVNILHMAMCIQDHRFLQILNDLGMGETDPDVKKWNEEVQMRRICGMSL